MPDDELKRAAAAMVEQIDALMPEIEKAIGAMWDRGDYFNGPRFGATLEALRAAAKRTDAKPTESKSPSSPEAAIPKTSTDL